MYYLFLFNLIVVIAEVTAYLDEIHRRHEPDFIARFKAALERLGKFVADGITLLFLRRSNSITALFLCENKTGLKKLINLYFAGGMKSMLELLFTGFLVTGDPKQTVRIVNLVWKSSDFHRCYLYFNPLLMGELFTLNFSM